MRAGVVCRLPGLAGFADSLRVRRLPAVPQDLLPGLPSGQLRRPEDSTYSGLPRRTRSRVEAERWNKVAIRVRNGEMPPKGAPAPAIEQRERFTDWVDLVRARPPCAVRGVTPGPARIRRLNRDEYAATIRDLLDIQIDLTVPCPPMAPAAKASTMRARRCSSRRCSPKSTCRPRSSPWTSRPRNTSPAKGSSWRGRATASRRNRPRAKS